MTHGSPAGGGASATLAVDTFLESKLTRPPARVDWIDRPRLVSKLDAMTARRPVVLVAAPAGFGKTTLVAQWMASTTSQQTAWVSIDAGDNDPVRLWTHVATALQRSHCDLGQDVAALVAANSDDITARVLPALLNAMALMGEDIVLLVDDLHLVHEPTCYDQLAFLAEHLPPRAHLVIVTRSDPDLHLGRLRASSRLGEIRAADLAFDSEEASALLAREQVTLSADSVEHLMQRTEGWPVGMYLASLSISRHEDPDEFALQFGGDSRFTGDYLIEEVLAQHPDEVRDFIIKVSILDRLCVALCDFVAETTSSADILRELERTNMFLVPLDEQRQWYRFHPLFAAAARHELEVQHDDLVASVHGRAGEWFRDHGHTDAAIEHLLAAGRTGEAALLVQAHWQKYLNAGRTATVGAWLETIGPPTIAKVPAAGVTAAWMAAMSGDAAGLARHVEDLQPSLAHGPLPDGTHSVESAIAMIHGLFGFGGPVEMAAGARRVLELETDPSSPNYAIGLLTTGHAAYVEGDLELASQLLGRATDHAETPALMRLLSSSIHSLTEAERGHHARARELAELAMRIVHVGGLEAMPQASLAYTSLAQAQARAGEMVDAIATVEQGLALRRRNPSLAPWATMHQLLVSARVACATGELILARQLIDETRGLIGRFPDGMDRMRARLAAVEGLLASPVRGVLIEPLTDREAEVLRLLQGSISLNAIADRLYLSRNTVKTHTQALYRKLGVTSRADAVRVARDHLLV